MPGISVAVELSTLLMIYLSLLTGDYSALVFASHWPFVIVRSGPQLRDASCWIPLIEEDGWETRIQNPH